MAVGGKIEKRLYANVSWTNWRRQRGKDPLSSDAGCLIQGDAGNDKVLELAAEKAGMEQAAAAGLVGYRPGMRWWNRSASYVAEGSGESIDRKAQ